MARQRPTCIPTPHFDPGVPQVEIEQVRYQLAVNRCRNEEIIVKGNFGWAWPMWAGCPRINHNVIREVQYQFEVNRCRNEEIIVKGNFGWAWSMWAWPMWAWPMWAGHPRIIRIAIREVQYQFEDIRCSLRFTQNFQGSSAYSVGGESGQDGRTDGRMDGDNHNIPTFFPKSVGIMKPK
ncbi:hypothetical protein DPMN_013362 [Dreissena polymorpha]|uniref:Uncharacterized protein n=1 Tax=Dreissena polymorpha TaxID=45954 RepID=A0A9D4N8V5_DREPO|nr:hypothetical protein DPMN_013362 [Dreissena polymorpha]